MISMRVMWHHFYIGLVCKNPFPYWELVLIALFTVLSNFVKGPITSNMLSYFSFCILWSTTHNCLSKQILLLSLTDSIIINIIHIIHTVLATKSKQSFADVFQNRSSLKCLNIQRETFVLDSLFNKFAGLPTWNCEFFNNSFFFRTPLVGALMKEGNENISFKFYLQLYKY